MEHKAGNKWSRLFEVDIPELCDYVIKYSFAVASATAFVTDHNVMGVLAGSVPLINSWSRATYFFDNDNSQDLNHTDDHTLD